jgi:hypothetical protein
MALISTAGFEGLAPAELSAAFAARREMLNHLGQRVSPHPSRRQMKRYMAQGARLVWRDLLAFDAQPRRALYMPGRKGAQS